MSSRSLVPVVLAVVGWLGGSAAAEAACVPVVTGSHAGQPGSTHPQAYDGSLTTSFNSTHTNWQWIQLDLQCTGRLLGARRYMTRDGLNATGLRPDTQGEGFSYSVDGVAWTHLTSATTTGWTYLNRVPHAWYGLPYGWSLWLRPLVPVQARYVRFNWDDFSDAVNEVELLFVENQPAPSYEILDLGELVPGGPVSATATAINKRGNVAGWFRNARNEDRAVVWDLDFLGHEVASELEPPTCPGCAARHSYALDLNDHDEVVGYRRNNGILQGPRAAHWRLRAARPLPGQRADSTSYGINNEGDITGYEFELLAFAGSPTFPYRLHWEAVRNGTLFDPATPSGHGNDINDLGDVVGRFFDPVSQRNLPFFYRAHHPNGQPPQTLSIEAGYTSGLAHAINNARLVVGAQSTAAGVSRATLWRDNGFLWVPSRLEPAAAGAALGVNDLGHVVGHRDGTIARLWRDGTSFDLNQLIPAAQQPAWQLREARDINDRGEIVGIGTHNGRATAFLLRPVRQFEILPLDGPEEINDGGWIAGHAQFSGWLRGPGGPLPVLLDNGDAWDINDSNVVAGWSAASGAVLWSAPWAFTDLSAPAGDSRAGGVSSSGHAVGYLNLNNDRALFWNERGIRSEPLVGANGHYLMDVNTSGEAVGKVSVTPTRFSQRLGAQNLFFSAFVSDSFEIDSRGFVVGAQDTATGSTARLWDLTGAARGLGTLETDIGGSNTSARAINDRRQIVGNHSSPTGSPAAFLWEQEAMMDLNLLMPPGTDWELVGAHDVNDAGQVLGLGRHPPGASSLTGFVMTLSSEAEEVARLCRGWCEPIQRCGVQTGPIGNDIWTRPNYPNANGCVNGCIAFMMDPNRPHTLAQERGVRDCFLTDGANLCTQNWEQKTQQCCNNQGLGSCNSYYP
jgi:probable HAF family extracellular repeat protein